MHEEASSRKSGPCELFALWWRWSRIEPEDDQREVPFAEVCGHVLVRSRRVFFVTVPCLRLPCLLLLFFSLCLFGEKLRKVLLKPTAQPWAWQTRFSSSIAKERRRGRRAAAPRSHGPELTVQSQRISSRIRPGRRRQIPNPQSPITTKSTTFV